MLLMGQGGDVSRGLRSLVPFLPQETSITSRRVAILENRISIYEGRTKERQELRESLGESQLDWPGLLRFLFSSAPEDMEVTSIRLSSASPRTIELGGEAKDTSKLLAYRHTLLQSEEIASVNIKSTIKRTEEFTEFTLEVQAR